MTAIGLGRLRFEVMDRSIFTPEQWAESEFGGARLGDRRRSERLVKMAEGLARCPSGTLPQVFPEWRDLKAAYGFLARPDLPYAEIQTPHWAQTRAFCAQPGEYLIIEDTMELDYTGHPAALELGFIGDGRGRGFAVHSSLAVRVEGWTVEERPQGTALGLVAQQCLCPAPAPEGEKRSQRPYRARASQRWAVELVAMGQPPAGSRWIYIADRECDIYEPIRQCLWQGLDFIIRSCQDRRLDQEGQEHLRAAVAQAPILGLMTVELRARPGQAARTPIVTLRSRAMDLVGPWRPGGQQPGFTVNVLEARETDAPAGVEPLHWILLTSLPCGSLQEARRVVGRYATRWLIEEYHKAVQSGTQVETSQLEHRHELENLIAILAVVAVRLLNTKLLARAHPQESVPAKEFGPEALAILSAKYGEPEGGWTYGSLWVAIARLGGFLARKHDGMPGWQTAWRGWQRLMTMCQGLEILNKAKNGYG